MYENEGAGEQELRAQSYWTVLSGGFGHVFGACPIWAFGSTTTTGDCGTLDWRSGLNSQGSQNMEHFAKLLGGRHWFSLVPDLSHVVLTAGYGTLGGSDYATAGCAADSSSIIAYLPSRRAVTVGGSCLRDSTMTMWWVDPGGGSATSAGTVSSRSSQSFTPPSGGSGDWVLVIDCPSFTFPPPGG